MEKRKQGLMFSEGTDGSFVQNFEYKGEKGGKDTCHIVQALNLSDFKMPKQSGQESPIDSKQLLADQTVIKITKK